VHHRRRRGTDAALLVAFAGVEGPPLGPVIDLVFLDDQATLLTDRLAALAVGDERPGTLRTDLRLLVLLVLVFGVRSFLGCRSRCYLTHDGGRTRVARRLGILLTCS
jgi:hypothetical protein